MHPPPVFFNTTFRCCSQKIATVAPQERGTQLCGSLCASLCARRLCQTPQCGRPPARPRPRARAQGVAQRRRQRPEVSLLHGRRRGQARHSAVHVDAALRRGAMGGKTRLLGVLLSTRRAGGGGWAGRRVAYLMILLAESVKFEKVRGALTTARRLCPSWCWLAVCPRNFATLPAAPRWWAQGKELSKQVAQRRVADNYNN